MTMFPGLPKLIKGGIVLLNPDTSAVQPIIALQYNSDTLIYKHINLRESHANCKL